MKTVHLRTALSFSPLLPAILLTCPLSAQDQPTFTVDVNVVNVLATVRDQDGRVVSDLSKEDFILEENGEVQEIRYFTRQTDLPLTIGLLFDTSMSQWRLIDRQRSASFQFFQQVLRPEEDMAFLIKFGVDVELLQDLTSSRSLLEQALDELRTPRVFPSRMSGGVRSNYQGLPGGIRLPDIFGVPGGRGGGRGGGRSGDGRGGGRPGGGPGADRGGGPRGMTGIGTALYDAVFLASDEMLRDQAGRKTVVLISDGVDMGSMVGMYDAIEAAQRADAIVYSVRYFDDQSRPFGPGGRGGMGRPGGRGGDMDARGEDALQRMSAETGGRMFEVSHGLSLEEIFEQIQEELRNQYSIGYAPPADSDGEFRRIKVRTKDRKLKVQTREGYYPKS